LNERGTFRKRSSSCRAPPPASIQTFAPGCAECVHGGNTTAGGHVRIIISARPTKELPQGRAASWLSRTDGTLSDGC